jgi:hypothetical protein
MDRRRYVPSAEGLEDRALLATISQLVNPNTAINPLTLPNTAADKAMRIQNLPFFLARTQKGRFLPKAVMTQLQADLSPLKGVLHAPPEATIDNFDLQLRDVIPNQTLSVSAAHALNQSFGTVLHFAGVTPQEQAALQADMNALARTDANDINPVILATNDYTIVLETALGVGRPIPTPTVPQLAAVDAIGGAGSHITRNPHPHLVGTYDDAQAAIEIVDDAGTVLGFAQVVAKGVYAGKYSVAFDQPLAVGVYTVHVRAVDTGLVSGPSVAYKFRVVAPKHVVAAAHPQGPLAHH